MDRVPNVWIKELYKVKKGLDERIDEAVLRWRGWRMIGLPRECAGSRSVGRLQKRWIDTMKTCLRKRGVDVREARRMVGVCEGCILGDEPLTLMR